VAQKYFVISVKHILITEITKTIAKNN